MTAAAMARLVAGARARLQRRRVTHPAAVSPQGPVSLRSISNAALRLLSRQSFLRGTWTTMRRSADAKWGAKRIEMVGEGSFLQFSFCFQFFSKLYTFLSCRSSFQLSPFIAMLFRYNICFCFWKRNSRLIWVFRLSCAFDFSSSSVTSLPTRTSNHSLVIGLQKQPIHPNRYRYHSTQPAALSVLPSLSVHTTGHQNRNKKHRRRGHFRTITIAE